MKKTCLIAGLILAGALAASAQTNVSAAPPPRAPTIIDSDRADFDITSRRAFYYGNVRVDDPQMKLTCEQLTAELPQTGGHITNLVALTNVVMDSVDEKGQTNHATCDKAVYLYQVTGGVTNETVTLSGNARVENAQGWLTGEPIVWDRANNSLHAQNQKMIFRQNIGSVLTSTNRPGPITNFPSGMTGLPLTKTNFPPGTIQNIDRINNNNTQTQ